MRRKIKQKKEKTKQRQRIERMINHKGKRKERRKEKNSLFVIHLLEDRRSLTLGGETNFKNPSLIRIPRPFPPIALCTQLIKVECKGNGQSFTHTSKHARARTYTKKNIFFLCIFISTIYLF